MSDHRGDDVGVVNLLPGTGHLTEQGEQVSGDGSIIFNDAEMLLKHLDVGNEDGYCGLVTPVAGRVIAARNSLRIWRLM